LNDIVEILEHRSISFLEFLNKYTSVLFYSVLGELIKKNKDGIIDELPMDETKMDLFAVNFFKNMKKNFENLTGRFF
jgi:hypothetical protein